jgi:predicted HAD superfamily Cof-like phosphohydrolase
MQSLKYQSELKTRLKTIEAGLSVLYLEIGALVKTGANGERDYDVHLANFLKIKEDCKDRRDSISSSDLGVWVEPDVVCKGGSQVCRSRPRSSKSQTTNL